MVRSGMCEGTTARHGLPRPHLPRVRAATGRAWASLLRLPAAMDLGHEDRDDEAIRGANFVAIEGNTSPGNSGSQANGGGVYRRARARQHIAGWVDMSGLVGTDPAPQASKEDDEMALKILNVTPTAGAAPTAQAAMLPDGRLVTLHDPSEVAALIRVYGTGDMGTITEADRRTVSAVLARADAHN